VRPWRISDSGHQLYRSHILEKIWPHGFIEIGYVTQASATYVASYIHKKADRKKIKHIDGILDDRVEEYVVSSKKNYVSGRNYIRANIKDIADKGCLVDPYGHKINIDSHTLEWISREFPEQAIKIKLQKESLPHRAVNIQQLQAKEITLAAKKGK